MSSPVHVAITRVVKKGCEDDFERAIREFLASPHEALGSRGKASQQGP